MSNYISKLQIKIVFIMLVLVAAVAPVFAQVQLTIPTDDIFSSINDWIVTFAPIIAIGIGIAAAIAILGFVGNKIVAAFKGSK